MRFQIALPLLASLASLAACASHKGTPTADPDSQNLAGDGTDTSAVEADAVSLTGTFLSSSGGAVALASGTASDLSVQNVGSGARLFFLPLGCVTTDNPTADSVTYTLNDCTGPRGLLHLTGVVDVTYATSNGALTLNLATKGLKVNRATIDWNATATIRAAGPSRTMDWSGHFTGTTRGGRTITRDNTKTVKWTVGDSCFEIDGVSEGTIGTRDVKTELISYKRCKASCPEAGSEVRITHVSAGKTVDIVYGTGEATFTDAKGDKITFAPLCASL